VALERRRQARRQLWHGGFARSVWPRRHSATLSNWPAASTSPAPQTRVNSYSYGSNSDGTLDASFAGGGGSVLIQGDFQSRPAIHEQADGKLLIAADSFSGFAATRTDANGLLDATFGRVFREVGSNALFVRGSGIDSNGKLIIAGAQNTFLQGGITVGETFIARLLTNDNAPTAITLNPTTRVLSIPGTSGNDAIHVTEDGSTVFPSLNGFGRMFQQTAVGSVSVTAGDGDDVIIIGPGTIPTRISGGNGSDRITGGDRADTIDGNGGPDFIDGGNGADLISGGAGNDAIRGEEGNDTIDGGDGDDELRGGPGDDTYVPSAGTDTNVDLDLRDVTLVDGLLKFFDSRNGDDQVSLWDDGAGNLVIYVDGLTNQVDIDLVDRIELNGNGGNDLLKLNPGLFIPATIFGGEGGRTSVGGNDTVIGGAVRRLPPGQQRRRLRLRQRRRRSPRGQLRRIRLRRRSWRRGRDTIDYSGHGNLRVTVDDLRDDGEAGENDLVFTDVERVFGGGGDDFISGGSGLSILYGGDGSDTLLGNGGFDALYGGGGNDRLDGGAGDDYLEGGAGNDVLNGGPGADQLFALAGNDTLLSDDGTKDTVRGGTGTDVADVDLIDDVVGVESAGDGSRNVG
jgi:Ca2+-binding RTX toxin-like protein